MRISKVHIHNYRSIADLELDVLPQMVLLGPNNHGKSNVLKAIEFALGQSKVLMPDFERNVVFSKSKAEKMGKPMAAICQLESIGDDEALSPNLKAMALFAYKTV